MELWIAFDAMFLFALRLGSHLKQTKNMKNKSTLNILEKYSQNIL